MSDNPTIAVSECVTESDWNAFVCENYTLVQALFENLNADRVSRRIGPLRVSRGGDDPRESFSRGPFDDLCTLSCYIHHFVSAFWYCLGTSPRMFLHARHEVLRKKVCTFHSIIEFVRFIFLFEYPVYHTVSRHAGVTRPSVTQTMPWWPRCCSPLWSVEQLHTRFDGWTCLHFPH